MLFLIQTEMMKRLKFKEKAECEVAVREPDIFYM